MSSTDNCTTVTLECPVSATIYGFTPNLGVNIFFCAAFGVCAAIQFAQLLRWKTWGFGIALVLGCVIEAVGYVGRILLHSNPWSDAGFKIQIVCIIIAPAFLSAGIYLTLRQVVVALGPDLSRLRPRLYSWIFIGCDFISLVLQGAGGGIAATADDNISFQDQGNDIMVAGIVWQVVTLSVFAFLVVDFAIRVFRHRRGRGAHLSTTSEQVLNDRKFKFFVTSTTLAFWGIMFRCIYRIAEMAGGWSNPIMQDQITFIVLEGIMCLVAAIFLTVFHPGYFFPRMRSNFIESPPSEKEGGSIDESDGMQMDIQK